MQNVFIVSIGITVLFGIMKFLEMRFLDNDEAGEIKPLKFVIRDALLVFVSSMTATYIYFHMDGAISEFFNVITETKVLNPNTTQIFTDVPTF